MSTVKAPKRGYTPEQVIERLTLIGKDRVGLKTGLKENGAEMNELIRIGFTLGVTAKQMVTALGDDPDTGKPVIGPARVFQIRDGK